MKRILPYTKMTNKESGGLTINNTGKAVGEIYNYDTGKAVGELGLGEAYVADPNPNPNPNPNR